mmetsp:Transcript_25356/g.83348  ORF Transcript_25356/g.83348 Transcript_25356/m.83348 type:complete len:444 (+) Transcript_25356:722-2053(+)
MYHTWTSVFDYGLLHRFWDVDGEADPERAGEEFVIDNEGGGGGTQELEHRPREVRARLSFEDALHVEVRRAAAHARRAELVRIARNQNLEHLLQGGCLLHLERHARAARDALAVTVVRNRVCVNPMSSGVHHVVVHPLRAHGGNLDHFERARRRNNGVGRRDGGDDVLDDALRVREGHPWDAKLLRPRERLRVHPLHVFRVVGVEALPFPLLGPLDQVRVLDAVRSIARRLRERAEREGGLRREEPHRALKARRHAREDDAGVAFETLRPAVHHRLDRRHVHRPVLLVLEKPAAHRVQVAPRLERVEPESDDVKLAVPVRVLVANVAKVRGDGDARHALHHALRRHRRLGLADVGGAEEKLAVQVRHVNRVHVNHVDVLHARQRKILEKLTPETTGTDDEHSDVVVQKLLRLRARLEARADEVAAAKQEPIEVGPSLLLNRRV